MPSHRSRSRSRSPRDSVKDQHRHSRRRSRSDSPEHRERDSRGLPGDAKPISEDDYFLRNAEFKIWLREEKDRYFDELSGEKARSYFSKFMKAWNRGKLSKSYYSGINPSAQAASSHTAYKWSFASKSLSRAEQDAIASIRQEAMSTPTYSKIENPRTGPSETRRRAIQGPSLPSASDLTLSRESAAEALAAERAVQRKRARAEEKEKIEDLVGPREVGREGMLEKKRAKREEGRAARAEKDDAMGEVPDDVLMGGGDSFRAKIAQRDAAKRRAEERRQAMKDEKGATMRERQDAIKEKDKQTMEMFKKMAAERFG